MWHCPPLLLLELERADQGMPETIEDKASKSTPAWQRPWPADELERVPACPVCSGMARELLQQDLVDNAFFVAPGRWTLYQIGRAHV